MATSRYGGPYTPSRGPHAGQQFPSYFAYRTLRAREEGFESYAEKRQIKPVKNAPNWRYKTYKTQAGAVAFMKRLPEGTPVLIHVKGWDTRKYAAEPSHDWSNITGRTEAHYMAELLPGYLEHFEWSELSVVFEP